MEPLAGALRAAMRCQCEVRGVIAVGNSAYGGVLVPTDLLLALIAQDAGFVVERFEVARHLTTSSQQRARLAPLLHLLRETSLTLRKA